MIEKILIEEWIPLCFRLCYPIRQPPSELPAYRLVSKLKPEAQADNLRIRIPNNVVTSGRSQLTSCSEVTSRHVRPSVVHRIVVISPLSLTRKIRAFSSEPYSDILSTESATSSTAGCAKKKNHAVKSVCGLGILILSCG